MGVWGLTISGELKQREAFSARTQQRRTSTTRGIVIIMLNNTTQGWRRQSTGRFQMHSTKMIHEHTI